jgi:hypothetical protein
MHISSLFEETTGYRAELRIMASIIFVEVVSNLEDDGNQQEQASAAYYLLLAAIREQAVDSTLNLLASSLV